MKKLKIFLALLALLFVCGISSAVSMEVSPTVINPGDTVSVTYSDLADGSSFSLLIKGKISVTPGEKYNMNTNNFIIPISLTDGTISARADNSEELSVKYQKEGEGIISITQMGDSGVCSISEKSDINARTYDKMWLEGYAMDENVVNTQLNLIGTKSGSDSGTISFVLSGFDKGFVTILGRVNEETLMDTLITVGGGIDDTGADSDNIGYSGSSGSSSSGIVTDVADSEQIPTSVSSVDGKVTYTGIDADKATITYGSGGLLPEGWDMVSMGYTLISDDISSSNPGILTFYETLSSDTVFVAEYKDDQWVIIPAERQGDTITANVTHEGTYTLMDFIKVKDTEEQEKVSTEIKSAASTATATSTSTSVPTQSPLPAILSICGVFIAFVIGIGYKRK